MTKRILGITGHRPNKLNNDYNLKSPLIQKIKSEIIKILKEENPDVCTGGMALGIDTLYALTALELGIEFLAAIPCNGQEKVWPKRSQDIYWTILNNPKVKKVIVSEKYTPECMQLRNEFIVDNVYKLIAVWDGTSGGTANCVKYAEEQNKPIIRIDPNQFR